VRSMPGPYPLDITGASDCDDAQFYGSDHAPIYTTLEMDVPILPDALPLHHCTIYLTNLTLYRNRPLAKTDNNYTHQNLTARSAQGKGVPLPVAGNKLQNLPPQLSVYAHLLVLHKLMAEPPQLAAALTQDGKCATNIVIGPMLVQREFLKTQQVQLRVSSLSGGKPLELGQAAVSLSAAAHGRPVEFDSIIEHLTVPAGFNLRGTITVVYTKTLGADAWVDTSRPGPSRSVDARQTSCERRTSSSTDKRASIGEKTKGGKGGGTPTCGRRSAHRSSTSSKRHAKGEEQAQRVNENL